MISIDWQNNITRIKKISFIILTIGFILATLAVMARHYNFKTNAYDTGIQAGVARNIVFEGSFYNEVMDINHLSDHFAVALAIPGLFFYIWDDSGVLFIFQNICLYLSVIIAFFLACNILKDDIQALLVTFIYSISYYLMGINLTDYRIDTLGVPLLMLLLLLVEKKQNIKSLIIIGVTSLVIILIKEDFPVTLAAFGFWVLIFRKGKRASGAIMFLIGVIGFYVIINYLMPRDPGNDYVHINYYDGLGETTGDIVKNILTRPDIVIKNLVTPPEKIVRLFLVLGSFILLPVLAPIQLLTAAAPIFYQMVSTHYHQYMFHAHYAAPALPFLFYASVHGFIRMKNILKGLEQKGRNKLRKTIITIAVLMLTFNLIAVSAAYIRNLVRYDHSEYQNFKDNVLPLFPESSKVISTNKIQPHLLGHVKTAGRLWKYEDLDAEYDYMVIYLPDPRLDKWSDSLYNSFISNSIEQYGIYYKDDDFLVFKVTDDNQQ